jgi:hypothetical protein
MHNITLYALLACITVNIIGLNYFVGSLIGLSGQQVSGVVGALSLLILFKEGAKLKNSLIRSRIIRLTLLTILIVPLLGYLVNYHGQSFDVLMFWLKRVVSIIVTLGAATILIDRLEFNKLARFAEFLLIATCGSVLFSFLFPTEALIAFTGEQEIWGDLSNTSTSRAFGFSLNANDAGFSMVVCYVCYIGILTRNHMSRTMKHAVAVDFIFIISVMLTGSRSIASISLLLVLLCAFTYLDHKAVLSSTFSTSEWKRSVRQILYLILIFVTIAVIFSNEYDLAPVERIISFIIGREDLGAFDSSSFRSIALSRSIDLIAKNPIFGLGFEDSVALLDVLPHNMFVYYTLNNGLLLASVYAYFLYVICRKIFDANFFVLSACFAVLLLGVSYSSPSVLNSKAFPWLIVVSAYLAQKGQSETVGYFKKNPKVRRV